MNKAGSAIAQMAVPGRLAPAGRFPTLRELITVLSQLRQLPEDDFTGWLRDAFPAELKETSLEFFGTGKQALAHGLRSAVGRTQDWGSNVLISAYSCPDVAASVISAGLTPVFIDVNPDTIEMKVEDLFESGSPTRPAVILSNLYGLADDIAPWRPHEHATGQPGGTLVIDDASQAFLTRTSEGLVGVRSGTTFGILSFGRGKALAAWGGGALIRHPMSLEAGHSHINTGGLSKNAVVDDGGSLANLIKAGLYKALENPLVFGLISRIPQLGIGVTTFPANLGEENISAFQLLGLCSVLHSLEQRRQVRIANLRRWEEHLGTDLPFVMPHRYRQLDGFVPTRLPVIFPSSDMRDSLLARLQSEGVSRSYPRPLVEFDELRKYALKGQTFPGAQQVAGRLLTLPVHEKVPAAVIERVARVIRGAFTKWI